MSEKNTMPEKNIERYISRYGQLRIVVRPAYYETINGRRELRQGKSVQFTDGVYETTDPEEITYLDEYVEKNVASQVVIKVQKNAIAERTEALKSLEEREAEVARREAALASTEAKATRVKPEETGTSGDELDALSADELREKCDELGVSKVGNKDVLKERIREAQKAPEGQPKF